MLWTGIVWFVNWLTTIGKVLGIIIFCFCLAGGLFLTLMPFAIGFAVVGIVFGIFACKQDIPPKWSWIYSATEVFGGAVGIVIGYGINFFFTGCCVGMLFLM